MNITEKQNSCIHDSGIVVEHIAERLTSNIRQLEGAVKMIVAYRDILNQHITIESVAKILQVFTK